MSKSAVMSRKENEKVAGRSAATGRYVLKPASKRGSISSKDANTAVKNVNDKKSK